MNTSDRTLNTSALTVGQELLYVGHRGGRWGAERTRSERRLTITKVLKNRLVCADEAGNSYRFIVEFSKTYSYRNGQVSTDLEGSRSRDNTWSYRDAHYVLYTTDDPKFLEGREADLAHNAALKAQREAAEALDAFKKSLSVETAEETIAALQRYIATQKKEA
ncbi:hypothetical protein QDW33_gp49 [Microbacterium phage Doobus]|uniref:hypothetical protein n=1 Tax=Microbacterium phage Doobus TaxID=2871539 RepID=UPI001E80A58B|nr:hypothetical protein QDW33_gp49 [Microbacterium phage Doobus]QZE10269.1 hypothetical protein SEA_DOOBUS_49 [Microbacterium phage Doobus]